MCAACMYCWCVVCVDVLCMASGVTHMCNEYVSIWVWRGQGCVMHEECVYFLHVYMCTVAGVKCLNPKTLLWLEYIVMCLNVCVWELVKNSDDAA